MTRVVCALAPALSGRDVQTTIRTAFTALCDAVWEMAGPAEPAPPDSLYLDLRQLQRNDQLTEVDCIRQLQAEAQRRSGLVVRVGVGAGKFAARIAARLAERDGVHVISPGGDRVVLAPLAIGAFPAPPELLRRLNLFGIHTLGEFAALPLGPVQAQFGPVGVRLWRLASGDDDAPVIPVLPTLEPTERWEFSAPTVDRATLQRVAALLVRRLFRQSELGNRHARRLRVCIDMEDDSCWERMLAFHTPAGGPETVYTALRPRLDTLDLSSAAIALTLSLCDLCGERGVQPSLFSTRFQQQLHLDEALQQLRARLGAPFVLRLVALEPRSRFPERRAALVEWTP